MSESQQLNKVWKMCHIVSEGPEQFLSLETSVADESEEEYEDSEEGATAGKKCKQSEEKDQVKHNHETRPHPTLFNAQIVAAAWGSWAVKKCSDQEFIFKQKTYMDSLQCLVTDQFYRKEAIPTPSEFKFFHLSQVIPPEFIKHTTDVMAACCLEIGSSIKQCAVRKVMDIHYTQASVHIPCDDIKLFVSVDQLSKNIGIGDTVKVEVGEYKGISGWVTASKDNDLTIFDHYSAKHYEVPAQYVIFYNAPVYQNWLHWESDVISLYPLQSEIPIS
ncbi:hypothetical protein DXG01_005572 [Tephrocybe rancida]|nr:hypothetical protein DXG01_005572 [Tephrocybe rancida]